jgi:hypothetical protein
MSSETSPRSQKKEGTVHYALLTGAFEMGDPLVRSCFALYDDLPVCGSDANVKEKQLLRM